MIWIDPGRSPGGHPADLLSAAVTSPTAQPVPVTFLVHPRTDVAAEVEPLRGAKDRLTLRHARPLPAGLLARVVAAMVAQRG